MTNLVNYFLNPITWLVIGFFILRRTWPNLQKRNRKFWIVFGVLIIYVVSTPFLPAKLNAYLEDQYPPLEVKFLDTNQSYRILVLGGGMGYDDRLPATSLLEPVMLVRLVEGIRVYRLLPKSLLVTSGYSSIGKKPQAEVAGQAAILLGVDSSRIRYQSRPTNTMEEAVEYVKVFGKDAPLVLATSAIHMPRAVFLFNKAGVKTIIPAPTQYKVKRQNPVLLKHFLQPGFHYWGDIQACLHEIAGMLYARLN
jgi:uncharacterized SAM-binding protein YcdF (DUF218 family)